MFRHCNTCNKEFDEYLEGAYYSSAAGVASTVMVEVEVMGVVRAGALIEVLLPRNQSKQARNMK